VIATRPNNPRAASPEEIREAGVRTKVEVETIEGVADALHRARELAADGTVVGTGSIYLVGEVMKILGTQI
jgi:folylpolyglutamate synthase/dihydropteroate synthase